MLRSLNDVQERKPSSMLICKSLDDEIVTPYFEMTKMMRRGARIHVGRPHQKQIMKRDTLEARSMYSEQHDLLRMDFAINGIRDCSPQT